METSHSSKAPANSLVSKSFGRLGEDGLHSQRKLDQPSYKRCVVPVCPDFQETYTDVFLAHVRLSLKSDFGSSVLNHDMATEPEAMIFVPNNSARRDEHSALCASGQRCKYQQEVLCRDGHRSTSYKMA